MVSFINLPDEVFGNILSVWIRQLSLRTIDSAFCNKKDRKMLFQMYSSHFVFPNSSEIRNCTINWLTRRSMKVRELVLSDKDDTFENENKRIFDLNLTKVESITSLSNNIDSNKITELLNSCPLLRTMHLGCGIFKMHEILPNIDKQILKQLTRIPTIRYNSLSLISEYCRNLVAICLVTAGCVGKASDEETLTNIVKIIQNNHKLDVIEIVANNLSTQMITNIATHCTILKCLIYNSTISDLNFPNILHSFINTKFDSNKRLVVNCSNTPFLKYIHPHYNNKTYGLIVDTNHFNSQNIVPLLILPAAHITELVLSKLYFILPCMVIEILKNNLHLKRLIVKSCMGVKNGDKKGGINEYLLDSGHGCVVNYET
jgi:hypothetical protein